MEEAPKPVAWKGGVLCGTVELVGLAVWVGGLLTILGTMIPEVFNLGVEAGGRLLTKVFARFNQLVLVAIGLLVTVAGIRWWLSTKRAMLNLSITRWEAALLTGMVLIHVILVVFLVPDSVARQEAAFAAQGETARKVAHEAFFASHQWVRSLYVVNLALGIGLLSVKVRTWMGLTRRTL